MELMEMARLVGTIPPMDYPDSDGEPMGDNDVQIDLMILLRQGLRLLLDGQQVYVTANVFWYPIEGQPTIVTAPDLLVAFGRPPGTRRSYRQWEEDHVTPQVVAEVVSPTNTPAELARKLAWYDRFGVEEHWVLDPLGGSVAWYRRERAAGPLVQQRWTPKPPSPRLGITFRIDQVVDLGRRQTRVTPVGPDGTPFGDYVQVALRARQETARADAASARADAAEAELATLRARPPDI